MKAWLRKLLPKSLAYRLASLLAAWRRRAFPEKIVQHNYCGQPLTLQIADAMAQGWYDHDWVDVMIEIEELKKRKLRPGAKVFDIGAHQGVVALLLSRAIGPDGVVVAVEADPWNAKAAEINRKLNKVANIRVLNAAAGETDGIPDHEAREGLDRVFDWSQKDVGFLCLDTLAKQYGYPDVVYVDVDGFETAVLQGARSILATDADWFVEVHVGCGLENEGSTWQEVLSFFPADSYSRLIASDKQLGFVPFCDTSPLLTDRFYLLACANQGQQVHTDYCAETMEVPSVLDFKHP